MSPRIEVFEDLRPYLFSIAYRMLGSVAGAEDVVQETFIRWDGSDEVRVESPKAYLSKIVTRLCIDELRSARSRRETYVGPWLPEPLVGEAPDPVADVERADSLSMAFLVVLETLNPVERAVFLLREVFGFDYAEIAEMVGRTEENCRQLAHRAKQHISARRPRYEVSKDKRDELTFRFVQACALGDLEGLRSLLTEDITLWSDGGGVVKAARKPIYGADKVARFVFGVLNKADENMASRIVSVNGQPAVASFVDGDPYALITIDMIDEGIQGIHIVVNPEKLRGLSAL